MESRPSARPKATDKNNPDSLNWIEEPPEARNFVAHWSDSEILSHSIPGDIDLNVLFHCPAQTAAAQPVPAAGDWPFWRHTSNHSYTQQCGSCDGEIDVSTKVLIGRESPVQLSSSSHLGVSPFAP
jgi:hypothetical protein